MTTSMNSECNTTSSSRTGRTTKQGKSPRQRHRSACCPDVITDSSQSGRPAEPAARREEPLDSTSHSRSSRLRTLPLQLHGPSTLSAQQPSYLPTSLVFNTILPESPEQRKPYSDRLDLRDNKRLYLLVRPLWKMASSSISDLRMKIIRTNYDTLDKLPGVNVKTFAHIKDRTHTTASSHRGSWRLQRPWDRQVYAPDLHFLRDLAQWLRCSRSGHFEEGRLCLTMWSF